MPNHPLAEVFGFPTNNQSDLAVFNRTNRICPYKNGPPVCTKSSLEDPIGVCSVYNASGEAVITCPIRFRQDWRLLGDAASFFFPSGPKWTCLTEVQLKDGEGRVAGNIDLVLMVLDETGDVIDYGALEVQSVYISGNVRTPFKYFMAEPENRGEFDWRKKRGYPRPDYLSSSRKRLAPQLLFKGGMIHHWKRKLAVALDSSFYNTLPPLPEVPLEEAEVAWLLYDLVLDQATNRYILEKSRTVYTRFEPALLKITKPVIGDEAVFLAQLKQQWQRKPPARPLESREDVVIPDF